MMHTRTARWVSLALGLALVAMTVAGCTSPTPSATTGAGASVGLPSGAVVSGISTNSLGASYVSSDRGGFASSGIWVAGTGKVIVAPDLALLSLGVEAREATVAVAREQAAGAMTRVQEALKKGGVADKDIATAYFNIQPITVYEERFQGSYRYSEPKIVGYMVTNQVTVKVRALDRVGPLLDSAVAAEGDLIRVNGISFTIENPLPYAIQAREAAVRDALAKAQQFASLTNITVGKLLYITETEGTPAPQVYERAAMASFAADTTTPISGGKMEVTVTIQAAFSIP